jgi:ABC transport system ATP-binding/permease protein
MWQVPAVLELKDVSLEVGAEAGPLLHEISLQFPQGHHAAIVGPSGCGKSTLLKVVAGLLESTGGTIHWQGRDLSEEGDLEPSEVGYVPQFSIAYDALDVWESVETAFKLRVGGVSADDREDRVEQILKEVGLDEISDRRVKVLSGGQKRRLGLALEMVTSPVLLLADEVTSGLDPKAEEEVVRLLHDIAHRDDRIVLSVTHSLRHLDLFDSVVVVYEGKIAYHGPARHLLHYFDVENPEQVFPRLTQRSSGGWHASWTKHRVSYYKTEAMPLAGAKVLTEAELRSGGSEPLDAVLAEKNAPSKTGIRVPGDEEEDELWEDEEDEEKVAGAGGEDSEEEEEGGRGVAAPGAVSQFFTLLGRRWKIFFRDPGQIGLHLALIVGFPLLVVIFALDGLPAMQNLGMAGGNLLEQAKEEAAAVMQNYEVGSLVSGLVMFQVILLTLMGANNGAREIAGERMIFEKEKLGGVRASAYVASKGAFLAVLVLVQSVWMGVFVKWVCGFPGDPVGQIGLLVLVNGAMTAFCLGISSLMRSAEHASLVSVYLVGFQLPLSGAVLALPEVLGWVTRPFIAGYWGWSGVLQTMVDTRFFEAVKGVAQTAFSPLALSVWVLACHVVIGLFVAWIGCKRARWE